MSPLQLQKAKWAVGERIDGGGFGQVFAANSPNHPPCVVKLVPKDPGAQRELLFVNLDGVPNVVPIIDSGETPNAWALVMPRADTSLEHYLKSVGGKLPLAEAIRVLVDVCEALAALDGKVVHRDLKPGNILLLVGRWCLADFGIARYAEATTAADTRKLAMSPPYAAPERWRFQTATAVTDVYALGVVAFQILTGSLPFSGPNYRDQHLHDEPARVPGVPTALSVLIDECLYKAPAARPRPADVLRRLRSLETGSAASGGLADLEKVHREEVARRSDRAREESRRQSAEEERRELFGSASRQLGTSLNTLRERISEAAPSCENRSKASGWILTLSDAAIEFIAPSEVSHNAWNGFHPPAFTVVANAALGIQIPNDGHGYEGRSHSLWYADAHEAGCFQWFETAFMVSPLIGKRGRQNPFMLNPGVEAAKALWVGISEYEVAWPFAPLTPESSGEFIDRWASWFAKAAQGKLHNPSTMPEGSPRGTWRRK